MQVLSLSWQIKIIGEIKTACVQVTPQVNNMSAH